MKNNDDKVEKEAHRAWDRGDYRKALSLFMQLAKTGDLGALLNVGFFFDSGLGVRKDRARAMYWYKRAYKRGYASAASNIATIYRDEKRLRLMVAWFKRAAALDDGDAAVDVAKCYLNGNGVDRHLGHARVFLQRAMVSSSITPDGREEARELLKVIRRSKRR